MALIEMSPDDCRELGVAAGDVVEVANDFGSTMAMAYPEEAIRRSETFMVFGAEGTVGNVVTSWTDANLLPYYKGTWASVKKLMTREDWKKNVSYKSRRY